MIPTVKNQEAECAPGMCEKRRAVMGCERRADEDAGGGVKRASKEVSWVLSGDSTVLGGCHGSRKKV